MDLTQLRELESSATPGPWFADHGKIGAGDAGIGEMDSLVDAEYVAASREAIPALLAEVERLRLVLADAAKDVHWSHSLAWDQCDRGLCPRLRQALTPPSQAVR